MTVNRGSPLWPRARADPGQFASVVRARFQFVPRYFSLFETVTGNFDSLLSRKNSLFFLSLDGSQLLAKCSELCSMQCGAVRERGPESQDFPVKFPVSREFGPESDSLETPSTAIEST
jgi:hypothetical protein